MYCAAKVNNLTIWSASLNILRSSRNSGVWLFPISFAFCERTTVQQHTTAITSKYLRSSSNVVCKNDLLSILFRKESGLTMWWHSTQLGSKLFARRKKGRDTTETNFFYWAKNLLEKNCCHVQSSIFYETPAVNQIDQFKNQANKLGVRLQCWWLTM